MKTAEQLDAEIAILDRDIAGRERRLSMVRSHRERLYNERLALDVPPADKFAQRDGSELRKPLGKCVVEVAHDGVNWDV